MSLTRWNLRTREIRTVVEAGDQFEAFDTLRDLPLEDFGLVVSAEPDENMDPIPIQTATLMRRWGRLDDADRCDDLAREMGLIE